MSLLKIALIGRPNVGKSALFNRLCKKRMAIVDAKPGVTRDRLYGSGSYFGVPFEVIDTGGIDTTTKDEFSRAILEQTERAIVEAESLILVVDGHAGVSPLDLQVAERLRKTEKPVVVAVNKIDHLSHESLIHEFHALGISNIVPVSAIQGSGIEELLQHAFKEFPKRKRKVPIIEGARLAIIGRPNVGKSSLINALLSEERCVVSEVAGTTRDKIEIPFTFDGKPYLLIDTAGIRRKKSETDVIEKFAAIRTQEALERCDICLLVADAQEGITAQEKRVLREIETSGKGCLLILNKWDLVKGFRMEHCLKAIRMTCPSFGDIPTLMISAKTKRNFDQIFPEVQKIAEKFARKIPTPQLNKFIQKALQLNHPSMLRGKRLRIYYLTQFATRPPKFLLFVNHPDLMCDTYKKFLLNLFRDEFGLSGVPIDFVLKGKEAKADFRG